MKKEYEITLAAVVRYTCNVLAENDRDAEEIAEDEFEDMLNDSGLDFAKRSIEIEDTILVNPYAYYDEIADMKWADSKEKWIVEECSNEG